MTDTTSQPHHLLHPHEAYSNPAATYQGAPALDIQQQHPNAVDPRQQHHLYQQQHAQQQSQPQQSGYPMVKYNYFTCKKNLIRYFSFSAYSNLLFILLPLTNN